MAEKAKPGDALVHVHPATLLKPLVDIRDRNTPACKQFTERLTDDVAKRGVQVPVLAVKEGDRMRLIDGWSRTLAAMASGQEKIPVLIFDKAPEGPELILAQALANSMRLENSPLDLARIYQRLIAEHGMSQIQVAEAMGVSQAEVSKALSISADLMPDLQERVASGKLAVSVAYAVSKVKDHNLQIALCNEGHDKGWKRDVYEERIKRLLGRASKTRPNRGKTPGGLAWTFTGTAEAMLAEAERLAQALKAVVAGKHELVLLPSLLKG